ncbi:MAG: ORF6N domain-containing protein [Nitrospiraceae bacterium]
MHTSIDRIDQAILLIRRHRVMLDTNLTKLYGVPAKVLNQAVRRNASRFPADFMFQLTGEEATALRSQFVTLKTGRGQHRKYLPYVFTNMRVFVRLREMIGSNKGLARRLNELEKKYDSRFRVVFEAIRELMAEPESKVKRIGFKT